MHLQYIQIKTYIYIHTYTITQQLITANKKKVDINF